MISKMTRVLGLTVLTIISVGSAAEPQPHKVTAELLADKPISPLLYSNFIELGYGIQVEPMWSEMLFNRSFEKFFPYKSISNEWFDLWIDNDPTKGFKTDWTQEDWYHSGYEHNAWFACPGQDGPLRIAEDSTFIIEKSPALDVQIQQVQGGSGHGVSCLTLTNRETDKWGGLAQEGKYLKKGQSYRFRGMLKSEGGILNAEVRIYPEKNWDKPLAVVPLKKITSAFSEHEATFKNKSYEGRATFSVWIPPQSTLTADDFSLMPVKTVYGWRPEAIEVAKRINPGVMRFPGGCFASFYDWKDGVGPYSQRKPQPSHFWGGLNYNDVGTAEFAMLCKQMGSEMMFCVNLHHPLKKYYEWHLGDNKGKHNFEFGWFADLQQGAQNAADWVAYCNLPKGAHPMADLRAKHGYSKPFGVKFWEMDNEVFRWFKPTEHAEAAVVYAKAMKAVDPTIKIGLVTYGDFAEYDYTPHLKAMLEIAGPYVDFLADRRDAQDGLDHMLGVMREYNRTHGANLYYCNTEFLAYEGIPDSQNRYNYEGNITKSFMFSKWFYAMNILKHYMAWQRRGGDVLFVNFNNFANTHSQCVIETPKEGAFVTAAGRAFELLSRTPAAWPLRIVDYPHRLEPNFQVQAAWSLDKQKLVLYVLNREVQEHSASFDLSELKRTFKRAEVSMLRADGPYVMNTLANPEAIERRDWTQKKPVQDGRYAVISPPFSFIHIVLE